MSKKKIPLNPASIKRGTSDTSSYQSQFSYWDTLERPKWYDSEGKKKEEQAYCSTADYWRVMKNKDIDLLFH